MSVLWRYNDAIDDILKHAIRKRIKGNIKLRKFNKLFFNISSSIYSSPFSSFVNDQEKMASAEMGQQITKKKKFPEIFPDKF